MNPTSLHPTQIRLSDKDEVIEMNLAGGILVTAYCEHPKVGGCFFIKGNSPGERSFSDAFIAEFASRFKLSPQMLSVRIVGSGPAAESMMKHLQIHNWKNLKHVIEDTSNLVAYFFTESGRLRIGQPSAKTNISISKKKRVLIVDDSKTIRNLLTKILENELEIVGVAEKPSQALEMIKSLKPDVITLDIHMPEMTGVEMLQKYITQHPIPTVMITSISMEEGDHVFKALELGAVDYIKKPSLEELDQVAPVIAEKVKAAASIKVKRKRAPGERTLTKSTLISTQDFVSSNILLAIGASTGGTEALREVFIRMPDNIPPTVVVQHIPPVFSKAFANRLNEICPFDVKEAEDGDLVKPNRVLIAPGGFQMRLVRSNEGYKVRIEDTPPVNRHKPSVDVLFDSVAELVGKRAVGVILTGMGADGAKGLLKMKKAGARTIGQDEASSVVYGMPKAAAEIGAVDVVAPLENVADEIFRLLTSTQEPKRAS